MKQLKNRKCQRTLAATALPDQSNNLSVADFERKIAEHTRFPWIVDGEPERQERRGIVQRFLATSLPSVSWSMFQYTCGRRTTGCALCRPVETADSAFLLTR